jgi:hypothetical protein
MPPEAPDVVEDILLWRVDVLVRRRIEPDRMGRDPEGARPVAGPRPSFVVVSIVSTDRFSPAIRRSPPGAGNWFWRSLEDVVILL